MLKFVEATEADIELLSSLGYTIFRETYTTMLSEEQIVYMLNMMYSHESLKKQMDDNNTFYIVYYDNRACGYIGIANHEDNKYHLQRLYLHRDMRGKNLGRAMMQQVFDHAKKFSPDGATITLNVNRDNPTVEFYKKMGWEIKSRGDFELGQGFLATDYIMSINV